MPQAILLQDVEQLGERGAIVDVSKGYLRNFLMPRKLAEPATKGSIQAAKQLRRYVSERGKIRSRRITGACRRHQEQIAVAVKRAREIALLPYASG